MSGETAQHPPLGVAIIGTGFIGAVHARSARLAGGRLVGVAASTPERSEAARRRLGAERAGSIDELVTAADVDVVHVATPNNLHEGVAIAALNAGKHVVLEKPVALTAEGAAAVAAAAVASGRIVTVPFVYRFHPLVRQMQAMVAAGDIGEIRLFHGSYQQDWMSEVTDDSWRAVAELGGASRAFADIGSHWVDLAEFVSGQRITAVQARLATVIPERVDSGSREAFSSAGDDGSRRAIDTEDAAVVSYETDAGVIGSVVVSQVSPGRKNRLWFEIDGADAAIVLDGEEPERLWVGRRSGATVLPRDPAILRPEAARLCTLPAGHPQGYHDCFDLFVADSYHAMRTGELLPGTPTIVQGLAASSIIDAVLASAASRQWVQRDFECEAAFLGHAGHPVTRSGGGPAAAPFADPEEAS